MHRPLLAALFALLALVAAGCGDDDDSTAASTTTAPPSTDTASAEDESDFCAAQQAFAAAQSKGPDAETPDAVEETAAEMTQTAEALADAAPQDVQPDAEAFAEAIAGLEEFVASQDYEVGLGGADPAYQSGDGEAAASAVAEASVPVDQAVQDECDRFLNEVG